MNSRFGPADVLASYRRFGPTVGPLAARRHGFNM